MEIVDRVILVVDTGVDATVGLRDRIPPERALLRRAEPRDLDTEVAAVRPFPFAIAGVTRDGAVPTLPPSLLELLNTRPIPTAWLGEPPDGLPAHAHRLGRWAELRDRMVGLLASAPPGVMLADHRGVQNGSTLIHCPELEGMVAGYPHAFALGWRAVRPVKAAILRHGLPLRLARPAPGLVSLELATA
jgi:hypothetical protein